MVLIGTDVEWIYVPRFLYEVLHLYVSVKILDDILDLNMNDQRNIIY